MNFERLGYVPDAKILGRFSASAGKASANHQIGAANGKRINASSIIRLCDSAPQAGPIGPVPFRDCRLLPSTGDVNVVSTQRYGLDNKIDPAIECEPVRSIPACNVARVGLR